MYRIPGRKGSKPDITEKDPSRRVALLQHGLLVKLNVLYYKDSSDSWISNYENKTFAFVLANLGYDVWLGNNRGNKHSRNHLTLDPDDSKGEFWKFSLHEMATHDLPAIIEFVLQSTGRTNLTYVGHSQGTTQMFAALSLNNDYYKQKLNGFIAFGPVTNLAGIKSSFLQILAKYRLDDLFAFLKFKEMFANTNFVAKFQKIVCTKFGILCNKLLDLISEVDIDADDMDRFLVFISHFPSGTSIRTIQHFADNIRNKRFANYDTKEPYNLENIKDIPIGLFVGGSDRLSTEDDNLNLKVFLDKNNCVKHYKVYPKVGHITFFISKENSHLKDALATMDTFYP